MLVFLDELLNPPHFGMHGFLHARGGSLAAYHPAYVGAPALSETKLPGHACEKAALKIKAIGSEAVKLCGGHLFWCGTGGAAMGVRIIPNPIIKQGKSVPRSNPEVAPAWAAQILALRKRLGMSQQVFAETLRTSQSNVAKWETGRYRPAPEQFMSLAALAEGSVDSLAFMLHGGVPERFFTEHGPEGMIPTAIAEARIHEAEERRVGELAAAGTLTTMEGSTRLVPLLRDAAAAGTPRAVNETEVDRLIPIPQDWLPHGGNLYAMKVRGDSMDPILLDGHIVIIDTSQNDPASLINEMVAADDDGVTIKWLREDEGDFMLLPNRVSVRHPIRRLRPGGNVRIVGRVVKWIGEPPRARKRK